MQDGRDTRALNARATTGARMLLNLIAHRTSVIAVRLCTCISTCTRPGPVPPCWAGRSSLIAHRSSLIAHRTSATTSHVASSSAGSPSGDWPLVSDPYHIRSRSQSRCHAALARPPHCRCPSRATRTLTLSVMLCLIRGATGDAAACGAAAAAAAAAASSSRHARIRAPRWRHAARCAASVAPT